MDKFPLVWKGGSVGELTAEQEALYTWYSVCCRIPEEGIWCAWAVGERGELRLGVVEPKGDRATIRRRFSHQLTAPLGALVRGELRPAAARAETGTWESVPLPMNLFRTPWLRRWMQGAANVLTREEAGRRYVALPYDPRRPFPLTPLFCFARVARIQGREYAVFAFDRNELPVFA